MTDYVTLMHRGNFVDESKLHEDIIYTNYPILKPVGVNVKFAVKEMRENLFSDSIMATAQLNKIMNISLCSYEPVGVYVRYKEKAIYKRTINLNMDKDPYGRILFKHSYIRADIKCVCGHVSVIIGEFIYSVECPDCGKTYELNGHIELIEKEPGNIKHEIIKAYSCP